MNDDLDMLSKIKFSQHQIILILHEIYSLKGSYTAAKPKIRELQKQVFAHFGFLNKNVLDSLGEFHKEDREKAKIVEFVVQDLTNIKVQTLIFFDEHPADMGDLKAGNFLRNFTEFSQSISSHLKAEKEYLFPLLESFQKK